MAPTRGVAKISCVPSGENALRALLCVPLLRRSIVPDPSNACQWTLSTPSRSAVNATRVLSGVQTGIRFCPGSVVRRWRVWRASSKIQMSLCCPGVQGDVRPVWGQAGVHVASADTGMGSSLPFRSTHASVCGRHHGPPGTWTSVPLRDTLKSATPVFLI